MFTICLVYIYIYYIFIVYIICIRNDTRRGAQWPEDDNIHTYIYIFAKTHRTYFYIVRICADFCAPIPLMRMQKATFSKCKKSKKYIINSITNTIYSNSCPHVRIYNFQHLQGIKLINTQSPPKKKRAGRCESALFFFHTFPFKFSRFILSYYIIFSYF